MEILKNFVFDLQRHAAALANGSATIWTKTEIDGPSTNNGVYYYKIDETSKQITGLATSLEAETSYLRVTLNGTTYTLDACTTDANKQVSAATSGVTFNNETLTFRPTVQNSILVAATGNNKVVITDAFYASVPGGGSVKYTDGGAAIKAAENSLFKIAVAGGSAVVESGSAYLTNGDGSLNVMWAKDGKESVAATAGTVVLSSDGKVSSLDAGDGFSAKDANSSGVTYTIDSIGGSVELEGTANVTLDSTRYLLTSDVAETVVTLSNNKNVDTFNNTIAVTSSGGALYAAGAGNSAVIEMSSQGTAHAYLTSGGEVAYTGRTNDSFGKYLGSITPDNNGNYAFDGSSSAVGETITGATAITTILSGSGNDSINGDAYTATAVTINAGAGNDTIDADVFTGSSILGGDGSDYVDAEVQGSAATIDLGDGNNTLRGALGNAANEWTIVGGSGNDSVNLSALTTDHSYWSINVGDGNNVVTLGNKIAFSTVVSGSGNDTITSYAANNSLVGGSGKDVFDISATGAAANISDYEYGNDTLYVSGATDANANVIAGSVTAAGVIKDATTTGQATISGSNGVFAVTVADAAGNKVDIGWTGENGTSIDASSVTRKAVLVGTTNEVGDTLVGGSKADTIYAGESDSVYGGAGNDSISIATAKTYGVYVGFSTAGGKDTVQNFSTGWDIASADEVYVLDENSIANLQGGITGSNVTLKSGTATMTLSNAANGKSEVQALINEKKVDLIKESTIINVTDDSTLADYYIGTTKSGISLSKYTSDVEVNLANNMFRNITTVEGGAGSTSILGGKAAESLKGGTGDSSLYGGAGVDTLVSGDGKTTFFATAESGRDVVTGFVVGADDTSDVLNVSSIAGVSRDNGTNFTLKVDNSNSLKVTQKSGGVNSNIQWVSGDADGVAKIGITGSNNNFSYDAETTNYVGGNKVDTVSLTSGTTDNFNVWLDQTGGMFSSIEVYDMKNTSGSVLMAGKADTKETIIGGQSNTSLWGGAGNTVDVLKSTSGSTTDFFYGLGDGNDSISGSANDTVNLYNINLSDITKADINSNSVVFTTTANNTVSVSGSVGTFKLADGTAWTANYSNKTWSAAE